MVAARGSGRGDRIRLTGSLLGRPPCRPFTVIRMKRVLVVGGPAVAVVTLAAVLAFAGRSDPEPGVPLSGAMPALDGEVLGGGSLEPGDLRGRVVVVNFWASWCAPCREEQPGLERLWRAYRGRGVQFVGVNSMDLESDALAYLEEFEVTYPSVADPRGDLMRRFRVPYLPGTVLVGADGEMRMRLAGARTEQELRALIEGLLNEEQA